MGRSPKQDHALRQREAQALKLRLQGKSFDEIASLLGYASRSGAYKAYSRALDRLPSDVETEWYLALDRYDALIRALWEPAMDRSNPKQRESIDTLRQVILSQARLLGLDRQAGRAR